MKGKYYITCSFVLFSLLWIITSCEKENPVVKYKSCKALKFPNGSGVTVYFENEIQYKFPHFNPNNSFEFLFFEKDESTGIKRLCIYNKNTNQKIILANGLNIQSQPKWSNNDWLCFDDNYQLKRIKSNGDSMIVVEPSGVNLFPAWSPSGNNLIWMHSLSLGAPYGLLKHDIQSDHRDTISNMKSNFNQISLSGLLISNSYDSQTGFSSIGVSDYTNINFQYYIGSNMTQYTGLSWSPNGESFYFTEFDGIQGGLFRYNLLDSTIDTLKCSCNSSYYTVVSCSPDNNSLLAERVDQKLEYNQNGDFTGNVLKNSKIVEINLTDLSETILSIP